MNQNDQASKPVNGVNVALNDVAALSAMNKQANAMLGKLASRNNLGENDLSKAILSLLQPFTAPKFSTSLGMEDQVLTHLINSVNIAAEGNLKKTDSKSTPYIEIFTLDTGRMFPETYTLLSNTEKKYGLSIKVLFPSAADVEEYVRKKGINGFYKSVLNRQQCCHIRKVLPLQRGVAGADVWITGMRSQQSAGRTNLTYFEWDAHNKMVKFHPLLNFSAEAIQKLVENWNIPVNELHVKGYASIGCAPCTRAVQPGESIRAGRWWWEQENKKECGLHVNRAVV